jgi:hypothetical protein
MGGTWSLQVGPDVHSGLTLIRLEGLVRSGTVEGHHLVSSNGKWMRVDEVPYLRRQIELRRMLSTARPPLAPKRPTRVRVGNVVHLFPESSLSQLPLVSDKQRNSRIKLVARIVTILAGLVLLMEAFFLLRSAWLAAH